MMNFHKNQYPKQKYDRKNKIISLWILPLLIFNFFVLYINSSVLGFSSLYKENAFPDQLSDEKLTENQNDNNIFSHSPFSIYKNMVNEKPDQNQIKTDSEEYSIEALSGPSFYKAGKLQKISLSQTNVPSNTCFDRMNKLGRPSVYKSGNSVMEGEQYTKDLSFK